MHINWQNKKYEKKRHFLNRKGKKPKRPEKWQQKLYYHSDEK